MNSWKFLKSGDLIDVVAPASSVKIEILHQSVSFLEKMGFRVRVPENIFNADYFHSNSDEMRFQLLKKALCAPDSKAVWSIRGGYGSNRLIPWLSKVKKPKSPKLFIGISDVTSIHLFLNQKWKWPTLHATLLDRLGTDRLLEDCLFETFDLITGKIKEISFQKLEPFNEKAKKIKMIRGSIVGGNMVTLQSTIGTPYALNPKGHFLFLEEIDERGYRIDRILEHFKQAGRLKGVKGILVGHMLGGKEPNTDESKMLEAVRRFAANEKQIPVWGGVPSGHDIQLRPLPFLTKIIMKKTQDGSFSAQVSSGGK